jgi:septal ring factor EnvC (AmiA/AmiB activator)
MNVKPLLSRRIIIVVVALGAMTMAQARAADGKQQLLEIERAIEDSRAREQRSASDASDHQAEIERLRRDSVQKARVERRREAKIAALGRQLGAYGREEVSRERSLTARREELAASLTALQRIARKPPEAWLASPASAVDSVRSSILMGSLTQRLEADARRLGAQLDALRKLRTEIAAQKEDLANNSASLERERHELDQLIVRKGKARARLTSNAKREAGRLAKLVGEAKSLRALIATLEAGSAALTPSGTKPIPKPRAAPKRKNMQTFQSARGRMPFPVQGNILRGFNEPDAGRTRTKGIQIATLSGAQVLAPHDGEIVFAGRFRSYGQLLIIAHGGGYHTLVAGLSRVDVTVGQMLLSGEPVGRMAGENGTNPILYIEMRRNGAPFDPIPWLAALEHEVSG